MTCKQRQNLLQFLGFDPGVPDGIWGMKSQNAMKEFQRSRSLTVTGTGNEAADAALLAAVAAWVPDEQRPETGSFWDEIQFFHRGEAYIACPCGKCGGFPAEPVERLMRNADVTRKHFGRPMIPSSTVRCAAHNASLKGSAANSLHMRGKAMDFAIPGVSSKTIVKFIRTLPDVHEAYAIDGSYVHMGVQKY